MGKSFRSYRPVSILLEFSVSYCGHRRGLELGLGVYHGVFWRNDTRFLAHG